MSERKNFKVNTDNTGINGEDGEKVKISVEVSGEIPSNLTEASEMYGGEAKLLESVQQDYIRRLQNAARPILRDTDEVDPDAQQRMAQAAVDAYKPGRKGGFGSIEVAEDELENIDSTEALKAFLQSRGIKVKK